MFLALSYKPRSGRFVCPAFFYTGDIVAIWIVLHEYPEGASPYLVRSGGKPTQAQAKKIVKDYKPRADSAIRVIGPYNEKNIIDLTKKKRARKEPVVEDITCEGEEEDFDPFEEEDE